MIFLLATLLGVTVFHPHRADPSPPLDDQTIPANVRERQLDTPEVVLQLKYDGGELNRIYLTQFRKELKTGANSVPSRTTVCTDLCYAGLGGDVCGPSCPKLTPVGLQLALQNENNTDYESELGIPRVGVCPTLCDNRLGQPLCGCRLSSARIVDWGAVCTAFCVSERYVLNGCPPCEDIVTQTTAQETSLNAVPRILSTTEGWQTWCNVQCRQGQGGAACNCDRAPI